jgi:23S rRNA-/tRNA-specific pseudouridylate synthase
LDDKIIALEEPKEMISHSNAQLQASHVIFLTCKYSLKVENTRSGQRPAVSLLNRLDHPVSGFILVAFNEKVAQR